MNRYIRIVAFYEGGKFHYVDEWDDQPPTVRCDQTQVVHDLFISMRATHAEIAAKVLKGEIKLCKNCCLIRRST